MVARNVGELIQGQSSGGLSRLIIICSCALMVVEGYDMQVVGYAAPAIIAELHMNKAMFAPIFSLGMFGYMLGAVMLGTLSDRLGRKRVILIGTVAFGIFTLATAFTRDFTAIAFLRLLGGIGLGAGIPATIALSAEYAPAEARGRRITIMYAGYTLGGAFSGIVAAQLLKMAGWPSLFVVGGLLPLVVALSIGFAVPESARFLALRPGRKADLINVLRRLRPDIAFNASDEFQSNEAAFSGVPVRYLFIEKHWVGTLLLWACFVLNFVALHFITSWLPTVLNASGLSLSQAAIVSSNFLIGGAIGGVVAGQFLDKTGLKPVAVMILLAVPFIVGIGFSGDGFWLLTFGVCASGITMMGGQIGLNAVSGMIYPTGVRSTGIGWALGIGRVGSILGPAIGGILLALHTPNSLLFSAAAVPVFLCSACLLALSWVKSRSASADAAASSDTVAQPRFARSN